MGGVDPFEPTRNSLSTIVRVLLVLSAIGIVILATAIFMTMSESEKSQGGRIYIVAIAIVLLTVVIDRYFKMSRR